MPSEASGFLVIDKSSGPTSHSVAQSVKHLLGAKKVGHSGTLDPPATGILMLGINRATRLLRFITSLPKRYTVELVLGTATDTLDGAGQVVETSSMNWAGVQEIQAKALEFLGEIQQIPPMYSAKKIKGKRLHELAREGQVVTRNPQTVTVYELKADPKDNDSDGPQVIELEILCSSGTYVRTLAFDLAQSLGTVGFVQNLRRVAVGSLDISCSYHLDALEAGSMPELITMSEGLRDYPEFEAGEEEAARVLTGRPIEFESSHKAPEHPDQFFRILNLNQELLAMAHLEGRELKPVVVVK